MSSAEDVKLVKQIHKSFKETLKPLIQLCNTEVTDLDTISELKDWLEKASSSNLLPQAINPVAQQLRTNVGEILDRASKSFGEIQTGFISYVRNKQYQLKELDNGWRIDCLELEFKRYSCSVSLKYNHETLVDWQRASSTEQLVKIFEDARKSLDELVLETTARNQLFWEAYCQSMWKRQRDGIKSPELVPILEFFRESNVCRYRNQLANPKKKEPELSKVAFLRNLDEYANKIDSVPKTEVLRFQTGSQAQQAKGIGVTLGGLNPKSDYRTICYIFHQAAK